MASIIYYGSNANGIVDVAASVEGIGTAGNSKYYGTNESGTAGFYDLPSGGGFADIQGFARDNADLESEIVALETATAAKFGKDNLLNWQFWL